MLCELASPIPQRSSNPLLRKRLQSVLVGYNSQMHLHDDNDETSTVPNLILVSHRGPVTFDGAPEHPESKRSGGGLVTALRDLVRHTEHATWVCWAASECDRQFAERGDVPVVIDGGGMCSVRFVAVAPEVHHPFYSVIANPMLWFIQHMLWAMGSAPDITANELQAWQHGYVETNRQFATAISDVAHDDSDAIVMIHDYHFYLVPAMLRANGVANFIYYFVHIPWPHPEAWRILPTRIREAIMQGILGADLVAFHTDRYARNFLATCAEFLGLDVDYRASTVRYEGRTVAVRFYPISIDRDSLAALANTPAVGDHTTALTMSRRDKLILRVDREDPSKNILRGFRAFERMLELHPELTGNVTFLALLQPTRRDVDEYRQYHDDIVHLVDAINARWRTNAWSPIDLRIADNLPLAVAAYLQFDVLMVNAVADGMNLVAKEALIVNECDGVLALSENTGAYEELGAIAVMLQPFDIEQQADGLWHALTMEPKERRMRHDAGVEIVETNNVAKWLSHQLQDIRNLRTQTASN